MSLGSRINEIRREKKISIDDLCEISGVPKGTLSKITAGITTSPTLDTVKAIARALGCRLDDLDDPPGNEKKAPSDISEEAHKVAKDYDKLTSYGKGAVRAILAYTVKADTKNLEPPEQKTSSVKARSLPKVKRNHGMTEITVFDEPAAAGLGNPIDTPPSHIEQYPSDYVPAKTNFGILISGTSMEPKIPDGSTVFVQATPVLDSGEIGIFIFDGQSYCKQLKRDKETQQVKLHSINPEYGDIEIPPFSELRVLGRVLGGYNPKTRQII